MADMASQLEAIAFRLRSAGEDGLARELTSAMRDAVKPVPAEIHSAILAGRLPRRGGYAEEFDADLDIRVIARNPGGVNANAEVSVYAKTISGERRRFKRLEDGILEHPLFGDKEHWYKQPIRPRWFTGPAEDAGPVVYEALKQALRDIAEKITSKGG